MANRQREPVSYRPFRTEPLMADGLLAVERPDGSLLRRTSEALFGLADTFGAKADRQAEREGAAAGEAAALAGKPTAGFQAGADAAPAVRGARFAPAVNDAIARAASEEGVDPATLSRIAQIESGGNPRAKNKSSSAGGLFQQTDGNARQYGVADRFDAYQSAKGAAKFLRDNTAYLRKVLGRDPTPGELYLAHQQGPAGAAKLLADPRALASSVVGADAVRLNGGKPGMQAGEFAGMWTGRFDKGFALPDSAEKVGQGPGTPDKFTIGGGTWRPSGEDTIYGRAYDEAGAKTYLQTVDNEMRSTTQQVFEKYRDGPAKLQQALGDLKGQLAKDHIFPQIQADYEVGFDRLATSYMGQARENARTKAEAQDRADFIERTSQLETDQQKRLASFDPASGEAANAVAADQAAIDDHYDDAVRRGILDPDDAAKAKIVSRRNAALGYYGKQAEGLDADHVAAMRKEMTADFADGGIAGLDGDGWSTLSTHLDKLERVKRSQAAREEKDFQKRGDAMALRLQQGLEIDPAELSKLMLDTSTTPGGKAIMQETFAKISAARSINDMTLSQATAHVAGLRKQYGQDATAAQARTLGFAEKMLAEKRKAITTDSVSYAEKQGIVPATPDLTEAASPDDMSAIVQQRAQSAEDAAKELGVAPRYLKAGEALAVSKAIKANPGQGAAMAGALVAGAGDAAPQVLSEFGKDAPMIAEAGAIIAAGGSQRAAEDVIAGYGKDAGGKPMKGLKPDAAQQSFNGVVGTALAAQPEDALQIGRAAGAIARKRIAEDGLDPASDEAMAVHDQAVQEAAGAVYDRGVQYGGFADTGGGWFTRGAKVWVPNEIRADRFDDVIAAVTDEDLAALKVQPKAGIGHVASGRLIGGGRVKQGAAATLKSARPVAVNGGFAFAIGDPVGDDPQWIMGSDGKPFVLDVVALRDRLAPRVPGAFR